MDRKRSREDAHPSERPRKHARGYSTHLEKDKFFLLRHKLEEDVYCIFEGFDRCRPYLKRNDITIIGFDTRQEAEYFVENPVLNTNAAKGASSCKATETPNDIASADVGHTPNVVKAKQSDKLAFRQELVSEAPPCDQLSHFPPKAIHVSREQQVTVYASGTTSTTRKNSRMSFGVYFKEESPYNCAGSVSGSVSCQRADLKAALEAIKIIIRYSMVIPGGVIELGVNSSYVKSGLESWMRRWKERGWKNANKGAIRNVDLWKEVDSLLTELEKMRVRLTVTKTSGSCGSFNAGRLAAKVMYLEK